MKTCISCNNLLSEEATQCYLCNTNQGAGFEEFIPKPAHSDTFLKVLCILTIVGAAIGLAMLPSQWESLNKLYIENAEVMILMDVLVIIGKLTGAILMLYKRIVGLYIYTAGSVIGIISTVWATSIMSGALGEQGPIIIAASMVSLIFPIAFLIMYWLNVNRRLLS